MSQEIYNTKFQEDIRTLYAKISHIEAVMHELEIQFKVQAPELELMLKNVINTSNEVLYQRISTDNSSRDKRIDRLEECVHTLQDTPANNALTVKKQIIMVAITVLVTFFVTLWLNSLK